MSAVSSEFVTFEDVEDYSNEIKELLVENPKDFLEINPAVNTLDEVSRKAHSLLEAMYESVCYEVTDETGDTDIEYDMDEYNGLLEQAFISMYEILHFITRVNLPPTFGSTTSQRVDNLDSAKLTFNALVNMETVGITYPANANSNITTASDVMLRATSEYEYEKIMDVLDKAPFCLKPGIRELALRSADHLFDLSAPTE